MDELKEIERKIVTAKSMADIRSVFGLMKERVRPTEEQIEAMLIVSKTDGVIGVERGCDCIFNRSLGMVKNMYDPNAIIGYTKYGPFFAGMADEIVRGGK